jgi:serine/threonine protein phosphatase PrpC
MIAVNSAVIVPAMSASANSLDLRCGFASEKGGRVKNEDFAAIDLGTAEQRAAFGAIAVVADGVGGARGGRVAAETASRGFLQACREQTETLGVRRIATSAIEAMNRWINAIGLTDPLLLGMATTLTALVLRGRQAHWLHVGDSRLYRLRDERLTLLTTDHTPGRAGLPHALTRAVGASDSVRIDYETAETRLHDRYLLCTDGVHRALRDAQLKAILAARAAPEQTARDLVDAALARRIGDNATVVVLDVLGLPPADQADLAIGVAALPMMPPPREGAVIDDYALDRMLADGRYSRVFRVTDTRNGRTMIAKFPKPTGGAEAVLRAGFLREAWVSARVRSPWIGEVLTPNDTRRTSLYTVMPYYEGQTLEQRLVRPPPMRLAAGLDIALKLAKGVASLHRLGIVHRDIKPDNVILQPDGGVKLIDLGVARLPFLEDAPDAEAPGTPSYKAPELFAGQPGDALSDIFALGVTIYRMFAVAYPYGEMEPFSRPRFGRATPLLAHRPELPAWLDQVLAKAMAVAPEDRFADAIEFAFELEHGAIRGAPAAAPRLSFYDRDPLRFWQIMTAALAMLLAVALVLRL